MSQTAPFKNLKQMIQKKNEQIKDLRRRLSRFGNPKFVIFIIISNISLTTKVKMYHLGKASNKYPVDLFADFDNRCISYNLYSVCDLTCYCNSHLEGKKNTLIYADGIILSKS